MKQEKSSTEASGRFNCPICNQTFQTQEELTTHNRNYHESRSGAEHQQPASGRHPGAERNPGMNREQEMSAGQRREPGSQQQDKESENRDQPRKRAAS